MISPLVMKYFVKEAWDINDVRKAYDALIGRARALRRPKRSSKELAEVAVGLGPKTKQNLMKFDPVADMMGDTSTVPYTRIPEEGQKYLRAAGVPERHVDNPSAYASTAQAMARYMDDAGADIASNLNKPSIFIGRNVEKGLARSGHPVPKNPIAQEAFSRNIKRHEFNEALAAKNTIAESADQTVGTTRPIASHFGPEVLIQDMNMANAFVGPGASQYRGTMLSMRKNELNYLKENLSDPANRDAVDTLLRGGRINRHRIKKIRKDYLRTGTKLWPDQV